VVAASHVALFVSVSVAISRRKNRPSTSSMVPGSIAIQMQLFQFMVNDQPSAPLVS